MNPKRPRKEKGIGSHWDSNPGPLKYLSLESNIAMMCQVEHCYSKVLNYAGGKVIF